PRLFHATGFFHCWQQQATSRSFSISSRLPGPKQTNSPSGKPCRPLRSAGKPLFPKDGVPTLEGNCQTRPDTMEQIIGQPDGAAGGVTPADVIFDTTTQTFTA